MASFRGLKAVLMGDDRGYPQAVDILPELKSRAGDVPLVVNAGYRVFLQKLERHELPGGVFYKVRNAPDPDSVNRLMDRVRDYRV